MDQTEGAKVQQEGSFFWLELPGKQNQFWNHHCIMLEIWGYILIKLVWKPNKNKVFKAKNVKKNKTIYNMTTYFQKFTPLILKYSKWNFLNTFHFLYHSYQKKSTHCQKFWSLSVGVNSCRSGRIWNKEVMHIPCLRGGRRHLW